MPEQQALQRVERLIGFGEVGEQRGIVGRRRLALPGRAELLEDLAEAAAAVYQREDFAPYLPGLTVTDTPECWCLSMKGWPRLLPKTWDAISPVKGSW